MVEKSNCHWLIWLIRLDGKSKGTRNVHLVWQCMFNKSIIHQKKHSDTGQIISPNDVEFKLFVGLGHRLLVDMQCTIFFFYRSMAMWSGSCCQWLTILWDMLDWRQATGWECFVVWLFNIYRFYLARTE